MLWFSPPISQAIFFGRERVGQYLGAKAYRSQRLPWVLDSRHKVGERCCVFASLWFSLPSRWCHHGQHRSQGVGPYAQKLAQGYFLADMLWWHPLACPCGSPGETSGARSTQKVPRRGAIRRMAKPSVE
ncbi:hypothetical protein MPNT_170023 [Candidatus Methylacidithermus pantelleriae]|uniref:Uncharacterized protein n=1 Tax=Candidatus Methylacidithermus pantelleriae TaxID=2744239 RepID=A0A8J2FNR7_9BACT|nr:hypothetical protein MPNT_170023 [Candidatus Methylacidithermus pantelleriae]